VDPRDGPSGTADPGAAATRIGDGLRSTGLSRALRAVRLLARDGKLPRWLRALAAVGIAPLPGPVDEAVLLAVAAILWLGYRDRLRAAWRDAADS
jgi:hypothetical protein